MLDLILLLIFMVAAGLVAVEIRDLLSSAIALGAVGFAVAIGFIRLAAPDLAIVQVVIEVISVVFFVAIILKTTHVDTTIGRKYLGGDFFSFIVFGLFALVFVYFGVQMLLELSVLAPIARPLGPASAHYVQNAVNGMTETGSANVVTSVVVDYRGFDTLGEATVLFTSVIGVISLLRIEGRKK